MVFRFSSLRTALLWPFVGLVIAVASAIGGLSYLTGVRAVDDFSEQRLEDVTNRINNAVAQHLATPKVALNTVAPDAALLVPGATASIDDIAPLAIDAIERRLWLATGLYSNVSGYLYYGTTDGRFIGVSRGASGTEIRSKEQPDGPRVIYRSSGPGVRGDEVRRDNFDPRVRPWYKVALASTGMAWSPIYPDATTKALTLTLAKAVYSRGGALHGVVATDIPLASLHEFVGTLKTSESGVAFIVDSSGELVATSTSEQLVIEESGKSVRVKARDSKDALIQAAYAAFAASKTGKPQAVSRIRAAFDSSLGRVDLAATPQNDNTGLDWTMLVAIPRVDHMGNLSKTVIQNIAIGLLAVAMAISLGLWYTQRIARDITRLSEATRLLASGHAPVALDMKRKDELGAIAKSMGQMSSGLLTDPLTGALNRATFEKRFDAMFAKAHTRDGPAGALVFVDLNDFKKVNDTYGHTVGDALLAVTAQRIASVLRKSDVIGRFGGDEFVLLLAATTSNEVDATIERCREQLRSPVVVAGHTLAASAAFGAALIPNEGSTLVQLIAVADKNMYREKNAQRSSALSRA